MRQSSFVFTELNGLKNCYLILIILLNINHLFAQSLNAAQSAETVEYTVYISAEK